MSKLHYLFRRTDQNTPPKATLIVMHGYGANEFDLLGIADYLQASLTVISFRAPIALDWGGHAWYHLSQSPMGELIADDESRNESEEQLLRELPEILKETGTDSSDIYLMGFSQGAAMCYSLIGRHDLKGKGLDVKGVIALSGYIPHDVIDDFKSKQFKELPVFMAHGEVDTVIPARALNVAREALTAAGAEVEGKIYPQMPHGISDEVLTDLTAWLAKRLS
jgi:phospholipase/carboxylesterase